MKLAPALLGFVAVSWGNTGADAVFASPGAAANALTAAIERADYAAFVRIAGRELSEIWGSGFDMASRPRLQPAAGDPDRIRLYFGNHQDPFPAPLVRMEQGWRFDGSAGAVELAARRILANQSAAMALCRSFLDAQLEYSRQAGVFASKIRSTPGQHDGLYWPDGEDESPLGPSFASAAFAETAPGHSRPLFGYYFRILPAQGLVAWPAQYGNSGIVTFTINDVGALYQKDLGPDTSLQAQAMNALDPDQTWTRVPMEDE